MQHGPNAHLWKFLLHLLFWAGIYALWVLIFRSYSVALTRTMTIEFCFLLFITVDFYVVNNFIIPRILLKRKYAGFVTAIVLTIALSAALRALVAQLMNRYFFHLVPAADFPSLFAASVLNICIWVLLVTVVKMLADRAAAQRHLESMEKERIRSELDYLKAQIHPHSLFNALNTIYGHIDKGNQTARNILLQFSELLRYQLYDCNADKVDLEKEIGYIGNYIAFQQLRKNDNLSVSFEVHYSHPGQGQCFAQLLCEYKRT